MTYLYVFSKTKQFLEEEMDHWRFFKFLFDVIHFLLTAVLYKEWPTILTNSWLLHMLNFCGIESLVTYIMLCFSVTQPSCGIKIFLAVSFSHLFSSFCKSYFFFFCISCSGLFEGVKVVYWRGKWQGSKSSRCLVHMIWVARVILNSIN